MPWTWQYEKADGARVVPDELPEAIFASQGDAESWLGENWRALLAVGIDQVSLLEDTRTEYGPMNLHPADLHQNGLWFPPPHLRDGSPGWRSWPDPVPRDRRAPHRSGPSAVRPV